MIKSLILVILIVTPILSENPSFTCIFEIIDGKCTCDFVILNQDGLNNVTIRGTPQENCGLDDVEIAIGSGISKNIPVAICRDFPKLETLVMQNMGIDSLGGNPFRTCQNLKTLNLRGNSISQIVAYTFSSTKLETMYLGNNNLVRIDSEAFDSLDKLKELQLNDNTNIELPPTVFEHLTSLQILVLSHCGLTEIKSGWFNGLERLSVIVLSDNGITAVPEKTFGHLANLMALDMSNNLINTIPSSSFRNNTNLWVMDLTNNKLTSLSSDLFQNQDRLFTLSLASNELTSIPPNIFKSLISLTTLNMSNCKIGTINKNWFSTMKSLTTIYLSSNDIEEIPPGTFAATDRIQNIYLEQNSLKKVDSKYFGSLRNLVTLNLQGNEIEEVDHHFINQSSSLQRVNFFGSECSPLMDTENFSNNKEEYMDMMILCFDNFDKNVIELETSNSPIFNWYNIRPNHGWESIKVEITAQESAHIGLVDSLDNAEPLIEIRLGENGNQESQIWEQGELVFTDNSLNTLSGTEKRTFHIVWIHGHVLVFRENERYPFMVHGMRNEFPVNFFGLRTMFDSRMPRANAVWSVLRIRGNPPLVYDIAEDIKMKRMLGIPVDVNKYLQRK